MATGPGKYDDLATYVREHSRALGVVLIVFEGDGGNGFSIQTRDLMLVRAMPDILRSVATQMEADIQSEADLANAKTPH
jgi:hypothetical protein